MDEGVVKRGIDVCDAKYKLALGDLGPERDGVLFLGCLSLFGRLVIDIRTSVPKCGSTWGAFRAAGVLDWYDKTTDHIVRVERVSQGLRESRWTINETKSTLPTGDNVT